jgi:hypothetical protein
MALLPYIAVLLLFPLTLNTISCVPDLRVDSIEVEPTPIVAGHQVTIIAVVSNSGTSKTGVGFLGEFDIDGGHLGGVQFPSLDPGESTNATIGWTPTLGSNKIGFFIDVNQAVQESNEANNYLQRTVTVEAGKPDLVVLDVDWSPRFPMNGTEVEMNITVANVGDSVAEAPFIGTLTSYSVMAATVEYTRDIEPNSTVSVTLNFPVYLQELPFMSFFIDPEFVVQETDTTNNHYAFDLWVYAPSRMPDLVIPDVWRSGDSVHYQAMNRGNITSPAVTVELQLDGNGVAQEQLSGDLPPGFRLNGVFESYPACDGDSIDVSVIVDSHGVVPESDETNNRRAETWKCDASPPEIITAPSSQVGPESATITWTTDEESDSAVVLDTKIPLGSARSHDPSLVTEHSLVIRGLSPSTVYAFYVVSVDAAGNGVRSKSSTFITAPLQDQSSPMIDGSKETEARGLRVFRVNVSDDTGIGRVEFWAEGRLLATDYSYPYELPLERDRPGNGVFEVTTTVFDLFGNSGDHVASVEFGPPLPEDGCPVIVILNPREGDTVAGEIDAKVLASDPDGFDFLEIYLDSERIYSVSGTPPSLFWFEGASPKVGKEVLEARDLFNITYPLDTFAWDNGPHALRVRGTDVYGNSTQWIINITVFNPVPRRHPDLVLSRPDQELRSRPGGGSTAGLVAALEVRNAGEAPARHVRIEDVLHGFYPTGSFYTIPESGAALSSRLYPSASLGSAVLEFAEIAPGESITVRYAVIPILREDIPVHRNIGASVIIDYNGTQGDTYSESICLTPSSVSVEMESPPFHWTRGETITLGDAVEACIYTSDYIIVTCPSNLVFVSGTDGERSGLMESMSRLAWLKRGVLGFLDAHPPPVMRENLCDLIWEGGDWSEQLEPGYNSDGYLLIVGEGEVVPSFHHGDFDIRWSGDYRRDVDYCDSDYGDSNGNWKPEIIVGRIIGDDAGSLRRPIEASIDVEEGDAEYGREQALTISGYGDHYETFVDNINDIHSILHPLSDPPYTVGFKEHMHDYFIISGFFHTYTRYDGLAVGDFTGSGSLIALAKDDDHTIYLYTSSGSRISTSSCPEFEAHCIVRTVPEPGADRLAILDPDDGLIRTLDLAGSREGSISITPVSGHIDFDLGDLDGDGDLEYVVASDTDNRIYIYDPGSPATSFHFGFTDHDRIAVGNVLGDGREEIVVARDDDNSLFIMNGAGVTLDTLTGSDRTYFTRHDGISVGDVCEDSMEEIVIAMNDDGVIRAYNATGHQRAWVDLGFTRYDQFALGDLRGDSRQEIVVARDDDSRVLVGDMYWADRIRDEVNRLSRGSDVIVFSGHGSVYGWSCYRTGDLPANFGDGVPFVLAVTCLSGNYEDGTIAEGFLGRGAAVYVGSTMVSPTNVNSWAGERFFENWIGTGRDLGEAFKRTERDVRTHFHGVTHGEFGDFWVAEYNLYGDPKFGAVGSTGSISGLAAGSEPPSELTIDVPDLEVDYGIGYHTLSIPGGTTTMEEGMPSLPVYTSTIDIPAGWTVQDVTLRSKRESLSFRNMDIPPTRVTNGSLSFPVEGHDAVYPEGVYPDSDFAWECFDDGGATSLAITVFPVRYDMLTANLTFWDRYVFDIQCSRRSVLISEVALERGGYDTGDTLGVEVLLECPDGFGEEVILGGTVRAYSMGDEIDGFDLQHLQVSGPTYAEMVWQVAGIESGGYVAEIEIRDLDGVLLDSRGVRFWTGMSEVNITDIQVSPGQLPIGGTLNATMRLENSGDSGLSGTSWLWVLDHEGRETGIVVSGPIEVKPGEVITVAQPLDTDTLDFGSYHVVGRAMLGGTPTGYVSTEFSVPDSVLAAALVVFFLLIGRYRAIP